MYVIETQKACLDTFFPLCAVCGPKKATTHYEQTNKRYNITSISLE